MKLHRENVYFCNLGPDSRGRWYSSEIKRNVRSLCIKFINKALSSLSLGRRPSLDRTAL